MSDRNSKFHITAMFATVNTQRNVPTEFAGMLMIFHTTFYMPRSNGTFVLTNKNATYRF
jgi:hypothetical protein